MFFKLEEISDHPCCKMQDMVEHFFHESIDNSDFSLSLFPDWFRSTLESSTCTLKREFEKVHVLLHAAGCTKSFREGIHSIVIDSNAIEEICDGDFVASVDSISWYSPLGIAIADLMDRLYDSLDLAVFRRNSSSSVARKELYSEFIKRNHYVCPFCGIGKYKNRLNDVREGFDHFLNKARYPLSAANMRNLIPTCGVCNEDYKKAKDVLANGAAFYPYRDVPPLQVSVNCMRYPAVSSLDDRGKWSVNISLVQPDPQFDAKLAAWDRVYCVKERLSNEVSEFFEEWMEEVGKQVTHTIDENGLRRAVEKARDYARDASARRMEPNQIIRAAFFEFLVNRADRNFFLSFRDLFNGRIASR